MNYLPEKPLAHAGAYKCTAPDGQTSYQDKPCQTGAAEKSVELTDSSSGLVTLMADAAIIGVHAWARKEKQFGRYPDSTTNCLLNLRGKEFDGAVNKALSADTFFASPAGRKVGKMMLTQAYQQLGETPPDSAPALTVKEQIDFQRFATTTAGRIFIDKKFITNSELVPVIGARAEELKRNCGAHH